MLAVAVQEHGGGQFSLADLLFLLDSFVNLDLPHLIASSFLLLLNLVHQLDKALR